MKISCPNCHAVYNIPDDKLPTKVKKVKCRKCDGVMAILPRKVKTEPVEPDTVERVSNPQETIKASEENEKQGFSWLALLFAANYYAGYGKFKKGLIFALIGFTPITQFIVNIYAGFKAKKELPIGKQPFKWNMAILMGVIQLIIGGVVLSVTSDESNGVQDGNDSSYLSFSSSDAIKIKGVRLGMDAINACKHIGELLNTPVEAITELPDSERVSRCYTTGTEYGLTIFYPDANGNLEEFGIGGKAVDELFGVSNLVASEFVQKFINANDIPTMHYKSGAIGNYYEYIGDSYTLQIYAKDKGILVFKSEGNTKEDFD